MAAAAKKVRQKTGVLRPIPHPRLITNPRKIQKRLTASLKKRRGTARSNWAPHPWPVHIVHKKATLFDYSKPQKEKDLSVLHTAIKWRRSTQPKPKHRIFKPAELPFNMRAQRPFTEWRKVGPRQWPHTIMRRR